MSHWRWWLAGMVMAWSAGAPRPAADELGLREHRQIIESLNQSVQQAAAQATSADDYEVMVHRDPMAPLLDEDGRWQRHVETQSAVAIQGIIRSDGQAMVLIDDQLLSVGQTIGPYTIGAIQEDGVLLRRGEKSWFIPRDP